MAENLKKSLLIAKGSLQVPGGGPYEQKRATRAFAGDVFMSGDCTVGKHNSHVLSESERRQ